MLKGNWAQEMKLIEDKLLNPTSIVLNEYNDELYRRTMVEHYGTDGQEIGAPPTPMYETGFLQNTLYSDKYGIYVTEYSTDVYADGIGLEARYGEIWGLDDNEADIYAKAFVDYIENANNVT